MLIPIKEGLATMRKVAPILETETVSLDSATARVLRGSLIADSDQPAFDRSAMDGFAVHPEAGPGGGWQIVRTVHAGEPAGEPLSPGQAIALFTGSEIPTGATRVIPIEKTERQGDQLRDISPDGAPHFIRRRGEDCRVGTILLRAPVRIGPPEIAILAQNGCTQPRVSRLPRVLHLTTGDELVDPSEKPSGAQIRDTNGPLISALLRDLCGSAVDLRHDRVADRMEAFDTALANADWRNRDVMMISGGAAKGDRDLTRAVLEKLGFEYRLSGIDMRPGKPFGFATHGAQVAFVIPGNPVSHWSVWHTMIAPILRQMLGLDPELPKVRLPLADQWKTGADPRMLRWPAKVGAVGGNLKVHPLPLASSGDLSRLAGANALVHHQPNGQTVEAGTLVELELLH